MKFTDGNWLLRKGVTCSGAVDVRDVLIKEDGVTLFIAPRVVTDRGQTLDGALLEVSFTSPGEDMIGVHAVHHKGAKDAPPHFFEETAPHKLTTSETESGLTISSGNLRAVITKRPFEARWFYGDKLLTYSDAKQLAHMATTQGAFMRERLTIGVGENIYGLGERFTNFVKNGQTVDTWNEDGGTSSEQAYKNVPFYLSNRGYGVFVNHAENVSYEIGSEFVTKAQFSVAGERLNYYIIGGDNLKAVVSNYCKLTGTPALPPAWSFGLWLSTSFTTEYDDATVNSFIDGMRSRKIPLSVFHFDCFWMREYEWCNLTWDPERFPDPEKTIKTIKDKGLRVSVWMNPYVGQKSPLFDEGDEAGYFIKRKNGDTWQDDGWQPGKAIVDFTNPAAVKWYQGKIKRLLDQGVDCLKTDFGERIPTDDVVYHDGGDPLKMHNYFTYLYNKAVFEVLEAAKGKGNAVLFARSATAGGQKFPAHWGGDCSATYESMAETLRGGLSLALGGFGFWSHDIGGFENTATADLYKRWLAFGLFSTHSRLHGNATYRVPWNFDDEASLVLKHFAELKNKLMPYIYANAVASRETGVPVVRPMVLEWQDDPVCAYLDRQYMFGESVLVAPVMNDKGEGGAYLPEAKFTHLLTGETVCEPGFVRGVYDYFSLPLYVRPNSIIVMGNDGAAPDYDYTDNVTVHLYEVTDAAAAVYDTAGRKVADIHAAASADGYELSITGLKNYTVIAHKNGVVTEV